MFENKYADFIHKWFATDQYLNYSIQFGGVKQSECRIAFKHVAETREN